MEPREDCQLMILGVEGEWEDGLPSGWLLASNGRGGETRRRRWERGRLVLELEGEEVWPPLTGAGRKSGIALKTIIMKK